MTNCLTFTLGRVEFMNRFTTYVVHMARLASDLKLNFKAVPFSEDLGKQADHLIVLGKQFDAWWAAAKPRAAEISNCFEIDVTVYADKLIKAAEKVLSAMRSCWSLKMEELATTIKDKTPSRALVETAVTLKDTKQRELLGAICKSMHSSRCLGQAAEILNLLAALKDKSWSSLPGRSNLMISRRSAKLAIAMNWGINELVTFEPKDPSEIVAFVDLVRERLKLKGIWSGKDTSRTKCLHVAM